MASANYAHLAIDDETTWGVLPSPVGLTKVRFTGDSFQHAKQTVVSNEIRPDRQVADLIEVGVDGSGGWEFELSYGEILRYLPAALFSAFTSQATSKTVSLTAATGVVLGAAGDFANVAIGSTIRIAGAVTPGNNGLKRVTAKAGDGSSITLGTGEIVADEASVAITISGQTITNGTTVHSFLVEKKLKDGSFMSFRGVMLNVLSLALTSRQIITGSIDTIGTQGYESTTTINNGGAAPAEPPADPVMSASVHVGAVEENGVALADALKSMTLSINNNLRGNDAISCKSIFEVGIGECNVSGQMQAYFKTHALLTRFIAHATSTMRFILTDTAGNSLVISLPAVKFGGGNISIEGKNTDIMLPLEWQAIRDATLGYTIRVDAIAAA